MRFDLFIGFVLVSAAWLWFVLDRGLSDWHLLGGIVLVAFIAAITQASLDET